MTTKPYFLRILVLTAATVTAVATQAQAAYSVMPYQAGNITYVTGGIGDEERTAIEAVKNEYNLSVISAGKGGAYSGDTNVVIRDKQGQELLNTAAGPLFYAQLPAGSYTIEAQSEGKTRRENITVAQGKPAHVRFSW